MQILPNGLCQFIDSSGAPLASGTVGFYAPGTLNPLTTFQDQAGTIPNANPVPLNSRGQALIWGSGIYRQILKDASGVTIWDALTQSSDAAFSGSTGASLIGFDGTNLAVQLQARINRVVDSIAGLRALSKITYTRAFVTGYYLPHDGGGGAYQYDPADTTTADNGGTVIVASDGGRWKLQIVGHLSVKQFGAKGDSTTDDTTAMNAAHATGKLIYYPASNYKFSTISFASGGIIGDGIGQTILTTSDAAAANLITYTGQVFSTGTPLFRDFLLQCSTPTQKTAGAGIIFAPATSEVQYPVLENVFVFNVPTGIQFIAASKFSIIGCRIFNFTIAGILIDNQNVADSGDSSIVDTFISTTIFTGSGICIFQRASGGLKIVNSKLLNANSGYVLGFTGNMTTGDLLISNTSIENMTGYGVFLSRASGTNTFGAIVLNNLQIGGCGGSGGGGSGGIGTDSSGAFSQLVITGCNIVVNPGTGACISLTGVDTFTIDGVNCIGSTGTQFGILIDATCHIGTIGAVTYRNLANPLSNACPNVSIQKRVIQATVNVTCSTGLGGQFTGSTPVNFPSGLFLSTPLVTASYSGGTNPMSAGAQGATIAGCTVSAFSATNGGVVTVTYRAEADF